MEEERLLALKRLRQERRVAVFDLTLSVGGVFACIVHLLAPWFVLFEILKVVWILHLLLVASVISAFWSMKKLQSIQRQLEKV